MQERTRLLRLCVSGLEAKGLTDGRYKERLQKELRAVDEQAEHEYFLDLYDAFNRENKIFPQNEHNNLIDYVLGLAPAFDIEQESAYIQGESPDIDIDYIKEVRDYLKREWVPQKFGQENVCVIGTYGTSGIKTSILDTARVYGEDIHELQSITAKLEDKDDEGKLLDWDKIFSMAENELVKQTEDKKADRTAEQDSVYLRFKKWCDEHPQITADAKLMQSRNRQTGVHAGGLVISDRPIDGFVPLEVRGVHAEKNPKGDICSAWTEGLATQDLQPVGLVKFDLLIINNLMQIALACHLIKRRHGLTSICAQEGKWDWSDTSYLNNPISMDMANRGDLKCIFQFDGEGIRKLVKKGGVTCFDDLPVYSGLFRPGPLNCGMDARYCKRKRWSIDRNDPQGEPYSIHPLVQPILGSTYGVIVYQEQVQKILSVVGKIPDMHTEKIRKAISKKKIKQFIKYKDMFIENGQKILGVNKEFVEDLWAQIESFSEYGFNMAHSVAYSYISARLLYLKAHYPLEFYAAILQCEKDTDKFREYKIDAKKHNVDIESVDINKSKENFWIQDDKLYFGFQNIKGIGDTVATRIVEGQPYKDFLDFLNRFGTDASVLKALISLGVFDDLEPGIDREHLRKFHEYTKDKIAKRKQRQQRFVTSLKEKDNQLEELLLTEIPSSDPDFQRMCQFSESAEQLWKERFSEIKREIHFKYKGEDRIRDVTLYKLLADLMEKKRSGERNFHDKEQYDDESPITLSQFNIPTKLDEEELVVLRDYMDVDGCRSYPMAESLYYGFQWNHILETSPDFQEQFTIDNFMDMVEVQKDISAAAIQVVVRAVKHRTARNEKKTKFYSVEIEDANGRLMKLNVWNEDFIRWEPELKTGNMLQLKVSPPGGGFSTLTLKSLGPRNLKRNVSKDSDERVIVMRKPEKVEEKEDDVSTFTFDSIEGI